MATGNNFVFASTTNLLSIAGNATTSAVTLKLYDGKVAADIAAANLIHTFTLAAGSIAYGFAGILFSAGIVAVVTLNGGTADILIEHD